MLDCLLKFPEEYIPHNTYLNVRFIQFTEFMNWDKEVPSDSFDWNNKIKLEEQVFWL